MDATNGDKDVAKMHEEKLALEKSEHRTKKAGMTSGTTNIESRHDMPEK